MNTIKVIFETIIAFVLNHLPGKKPAAPKKIINAIVKAGRRECEDWGDDRKKLAPNHYAVSVNASDWNRYYSNRSQDVSKRLSGLVYRKYLEMGFRTDGYVCVVLTPDASLAEGELRVFPSFKKEIPFPDLAYGANAKTAVNSTIPTSLSQCVTSQIFKDGEADVTPETLALRTIATAGTKDGKTMRVSKNAQAQLIGRNGTYLVKDGFRLGSNRDNKTNVEIDLKSSHSSGISRMHGVFHCSQGNWTFENIGVNGTTVRHANNDVQNLGPNETCMLSSGDMISFANGAEYRFAA